MEKTTSINEDLKDLGVPELTLNPVEKSYDNLFKEPSLGAVEPEIDNGGASAGSVDESMLS